MASSQNYGYWELPANVFLVDGRYDRPSFELLMTSLFEEMSQVETEDFDALKTKIDEHYEYGLKAFEGDSKFLLMFCWAPTYRLHLPLVSNTFQDHEVDKIKEIVESTCKTVIAFKCNGIELKYITDNNPLLFFALDNAFQVELMRLNIGAAIAKDRGYDA